MLRQRAKAPQHHAKAQKNKQSNKKSFSTANKKHKSVVSLTSTTTFTPEQQQDGQRNALDISSPNATTSFHSTSFKRSRKLRSMPMPADFDPNFEKHAENHKPQYFDESSDEERYNTLKGKKKQKVIEPDFADYTQARATFGALQNGAVDTNGDSAFSFLDPFNPPNLTYQHVKLLKNIDYSPLIRRANEGGMFTVEDVITILQKDGVTDQFKSAMRREHLQDPFIFEQTFDVFNNGKKPCPLCLPDPTEEQINRIHYTNINLLRKYISTSGMIIPRRVSGVCQMHQKKLRYAIKNAKQLALLSMTSNWHVPLSYVYPEKYPAYEDQNAAADVERERRMEIKDLYDNLVADKLAMMDGKSVEEIEASKGNDEQDIKQSHAKAEKQAKLQQIQGRITQLTEHYEQLKTKNPEQEEELEKQYQLEKQNIELDAFGTTAVGDENLEQLKGDFGDLHNLEKFDLNTSFDEFVNKYNKMIKDKGLRTLEHHQLFIEDSDKDNETPEDRIKRIQVDNLEYDAKLQREANTLGINVEDLKM